MIYVLIKFPNGIYKNHNISKKIQKICNNIKDFNSPNVENILNDSDITVLQKNYNYLFWSILATGTVLVTMNISSNTQ